MKHKNNFFVLTGGPGAGKSTVLRSLYKLGYDCVPETARQIIKDRIAKGLRARPSPIQFAREMFEMDLQKFLRNQEQSKVVFFDRSFLDSAALLYEADQRDYHRTAGIIKEYRFNQKVFLAPPWEEIYRTDSERDQTYVESVAVYEMLSAWYFSHGYKPLILPKATVAIRRDFILNEISKL